MVETAIALPVFLTIVFGVLLYGFVWFKEQNIQRIARNVGDAVLVIDPRAANAESRIAAVAQTRLDALMRDRFSVGAVSPISVVSVLSADGLQDAESLGCQKPSGNQLCIVRSSETNAVSQVLVTLRPRLSSLRPSLPAVMRLPLPDRVTGQSAVFFSAQR